MLHEGHPDVDDRGQPGDLAGQGGDGGGRVRMAAAVGNRDQCWPAHAASPASFIGTCWASCSRSRTTSPTTTTAGERTPCSAACAATWPRQETSTCWCSVVPS